MATMIDLINKVLLKLEGTVGDSDVYGTISTPTIQTQYNKNTAQWAASSTILPEGVYGRDYEANIYKLGNGVNLWSALPAITQWNDAGITADATEFFVAGASYPDGSGLSTGIMEIGTELVYVQDIDRTNNKVSGVLRGFRGTEAVAHPKGILVRNNPRFPVSLVKDEINNVIKSLYPRVIAPKKTEITSVASRVQYDLPADTINVLSVNYLTTGASKAWVPVKHWNFDSFGGSNNSTGKSINIGLALNGRKVQIVYAAEPTVLDYADEFALSNLPVWLEELIIIGACARLTAFIDSNSVISTSAEQSLMNAGSYAMSQSGINGTSVAKFFLAMYEQQIVNAQNRQSKELPTQKHFII